MHVRKISATILDPNYTLIKIFISKINFKSFKGNYRLPSTADYTKWGVIIHQTKNLIIVNNSKI